MKNLIESILDDEDTIINGIDDVRVTVEHKVVDGRFWSYSFNYFSRKCLIIYTLNNKQ